MSDPLILTAAFDDASASVFGDLRSRHFPGHLNVVPAHLTLFHKLPGEDLRRILHDAAAGCAGSIPTEFETTGVRFLGRGCALDIRAPRLLDVRGRLAQQWRPWLTAQDSQGFRPHVTVQNKVTPEAARHLAASLAGLPPVAGTIVGLDLWWYRGGPWEHVARIAADRDASTRGS